MIYETRPSETRARKVVDFSAACNSSPFARSPACSPLGIHSRVPGSIRDTTSIRSRCIVAASPREQYFPSGWQPHILFIFTYISFGIASGLNDATNASLHVTLKYMIFISLPMHERFLRRERRAIALANETREIRVLSRKCQNALVRCLTPNKRAAAERY